VLIGGHVSSVDIKPSTQKSGEFFGHVSVANDDGYFDKENNNQWVEKVSFIDIKLSNRVIQQIKSLNLGDLIEFQGKLVVEKWIDQGTNTNRQAMKVKAERVVSHTTKQELECLKAANL
jgi:hypothetical protein